MAIYRASHDDYENSYLPTGSMGGTAEDALDTAYGLCLNDPHRLDLTPDGPPKTTTSDARQRRVTAHTHVPPGQRKMSSSLRHG